MQTQTIADLSVVLAGEAGQGIQTIEHALTHIIKAAGFYVFAAKELMSRVRGGCNSTEVRIAKHPVNAIVDRIDILIPLSNQAIPHLQKRISSETLIVGKNFVSAESTYKFYDVNLEKIALDAGGKIFISAAAIGFILGILAIDAKYYEQYFNMRFASKGADITAKNISAALVGYEKAKELITLGIVKSYEFSGTGIKNEILFGGGEAVALGALAGGCNFISSYPMSPGTTVLNNLAAFSHDFDIIVEQAEDEISAINMGLGAWYAGARAMVTTSGGGFALMCEGLSLSAMTETPMVIHIGQRPAPATGLPTRTEQADLNLALYAGHGEFPRIILAPGTADQAFYLAQKAFYLADKFQIPVFLLTDQYLLDSFYTLPPVDAKRHQEQAQPFAAAAQNYHRYQLTENGISPRKIPGFGEGLVCVDSDEHTEEGYITEDFDVREKMVQKRLKKFDAMKEAMIAPEFSGPEIYQILVICWGSNLPIVQEAITKLGRNDVALLHFSQVFPLNNAAIIDYFKKAKKIIVAENNATAQFAAVLTQYVGCKIDNTILKYNGLPFSVEEIMNRLNEVLH